MRADLLSQRATAIGRIACGLGVLWMTAAMTQAPAPANRGAALICMVAGVNAIRPATSSSAVCAVFKRQIDRALTAPTQTVGGLAAGSRGDWIKLDVRLLKSGTVTADAASRLQGKTVAHPQIAIDVMDKSVGMREIEILAQEVAKAISAAR